jgi:hypothetical protein
MFTECTIPRLSIDLIGGSIIVVDGILFWFDDKTNVVINFL